MNTLRRLGIVITLLLLQACASSYFHPAEQSSAQPVRYNLDHWPYQEYWTGIIFNGEKIGFTHLQLDKTTTGYRLDSQAVIQLNFLGFSKHITLRATDHIDPDLQLKSFDYDYVIDDSRMQIQGERNQQLLRTTIHQNDQTELQEFKLDAELYPSGIIGLYPVLHGLETGRQYQFRIYDGETRSLQTVEQSIEGYESSELFDGNAWRIATRLLGQNVTTWINAQGLPVFELSLNGVLISALESETMAKRYLTQGVINKQDALLNFSLVPVTPPLIHPRQIRLLEFELSGVPENFQLPDDTRQQCARRHDTLHCSIQTATAAVDSARPDNAGDLYLAHSMQIPARHPAITRLAQSIADNHTPAQDRARKTLQWLETNIHKEVTDSFSALDVLEQRKAECQGHSLLYTSLARAQNIPTKIVNGLVYSEQHQGFLYHTWAESLIDNRWIAVDPTFNQFPADATHIKLIEGEEVETLSKILPLMGQIRIRILNQE